MRRVLTVSQAVQHHHVNALHLFHRLVGKLVTVAYVCERANGRSLFPEQIPTAWESMLDLKPFYKDAAKLKRIVAGELYHRTKEPILAALGADVREYPVHLLYGLSHGIARHGLADHPKREPPVERIARFAGDFCSVDRVEPPDVVESGDMVHVRMCDDYRVHLGYPKLDARKAHLGRRIYKERRPVVGRDIRAATPSAIARIGRRAGFARTADLRHAHRSAGA